MKRWTVWIVMSVAAACAGACVAQQDADDGPEGGSATFDHSVPGVLEAKRAPTGHVLVRCAINGHEPGWYIFDTGAGICVVSRTHVEELGLKSAGEIQAVGVGGGEAAGLVTADTLTVGPMTLHDHPMLVTDLAFLRPHLGEEIEGVIGYGTLSRCVAELDLVKPSVTIHDPAEASLDHLAWEELVLTGRAPAVRAAYEGHEGVFRLDTGANGSVTFHQPAVERLGLLEGRAVEDAKMGGVGGFVAAKRGDLAWFEIGGVRTEHVPALFATEAKGAFADAGRDGNIGVDLLRPFVMYFDYAGRRVAFVRREKD